MKPLATVSTAQSLHAFFDLLSDVVLVLDRQGRLSFANAAALRALGCEPGWALERMQPLLGEPALRWVRAMLAGRSPLAPKPTAPPATLPDGREAAVAMHLLDERHWALRLHLAAPAAGAAPVHQASAGAWTASDELLRLVWDSPFPATLQDAEFRLIEVNPAYLDFTRFSREQLIGRDPIELQPEEDRAQHLEVRSRLREDFERSDVPALLERRLIDADGRERWFRAARRALADGQGRRCYLAILQDCTAEHAARERADRSVRELDDWFNLNPVGMVLFDDAGLLVRTNPAFEALVGPSPVLLSEAAESLQQLLAFSAGKPVAQLQPASNPIQCEAWLPQRDGAPRRLRAVLRCYETPGGQRRYMAVVEDRSMEEERDLAQVQIGAMMDTAGVGLATFQESSGWVSQPAGHADAAPSAALQAIGRDIVAPESLPEFERVQHALRHTERAEARYAIRHPELGLRWLLTRVEPATLASGKRTTSVVTLDITEQHQTQQRSEQLLHEMTTILESTSTGIAYVRGNVLVRCNQRFENMLGLAAGQAAGSSLAELFAQQPQAARIAQETMRSLAEGLVHEAEFEVAPPGDPDGAPLWYGLSVRRSGPASATIEAIAVLSDITRLKAQQAELERLARDSELMFSLSEVGIAFIRDGRIQRANEAFATLAGYPVAELPELGLDALFADPVEFARLWGREDEALRRRGRWSGERALRRRDGQLLRVQVSKKLVVEGDPAGGIIASYVNVDARHRAEQAVALQAERTRAILDSVLVGIVTVGARGIEWMNRSARRMFGGDLADFVNQPMSTVATPEAGHPFRQTQYLNDLVEGQAETFECRVKARDGREFWIVGNAVATGRESTGRQLTYALLDIERRRQAEARIAEAQASLQRLIEMAPLAIALRDARTLRVVQINQVAADIVGRPIADVIGCTPEQMHSPELAATMRHDMQAALAEGGLTKREYVIAVVGEPRVWDARYLPIGKAGQAPDQLLLVATDVTEQRAAQEARLEAAIAQREMLVKEVHHRIKNNLQGVAGLLQQIATRKPEMETAIAEVVSQVQAIAQVYGLQVGAGGPLRMVQVVEAIIASVQRTFGHAIVLAVEGVDAARWTLPEAESIPIALTVNELLTNAIKHRADRADGSAAARELRCRLVCADAEVRIEISNPGQLGPGFSLAGFAGGVAGLGLVRALLPRRSASLQIEQHGERVLATVSLTPPSVSRSDAS